jgi:hypothetical protein
MKHTPGPWTVEPYLTPERDDDPMGVYEVQPAADELTELYFKMDPDEDEDFYEKVHDVNQANARLIAASPTMYGKLKDTVAWLDREIENLSDCSPGYFIAAQIERLEELRDDLAETLQKIEEA